MKSTFLFLSGVLMGILFTSALLISIYTHQQNKVSKVYYPEELDQAEKGDMLVVEYISRDSISLEFCTANRFVTSNSFQKLQHTPNREPNIFNIDKIQEIIYK